MDESHLESIHTPVVEKTSNINDGAVTTDVIAELSAFAPSNEVRDCLRLYQPEKTTMQLKASINRKSKNVVSNALEYLGVFLIWSDYMKADCVHRLICRLKNLYPKQCEHCRDLYRVDKDDAPLLPCKRCGQDVHKECIMHILNIDDDDVTDLT